MLFLSKRTVLGILIAFPNSSIKAEGIDANLKHLYVHKIFKFYAPK